MSRKKAAQGTTNAPNKINIFSDDPLTNILRDSQPIDVVNEFENTGTGLYDLEYFSGSQAAVYIGDCLVDEVIDFQYSLNQSKQPIYGYASQLWDDVSFGNVIVQGQFTVNFKESGYLWLVLHRYKAMNLATDNILEKYSGGIDKSLEGPASVLRKNHGGSSDRWMTNPPFARLLNKENNSKIDVISRASIERLVSGEASKSERFDFYQSLAGYATVDNPNRKDKAFEDIVEAFEDEVWAAGPSISDLDVQTRRVDDNFFDNFDLFVVYGDYTNPGSNHTVRRIRDVRILGQSQVISSTGEPIYETYTFIARNIV